MKEQSLKTAQNVCILIVGCHKDEQSIAFSGDALDGLGALRKEHVRKTGNDHSHNP